MTRTMTTTALAALVTLSLVLSFPAEAGETRATAQGPSHISAESSDTAPRSKKALGRWAQTASE